MPTIFLITSWRVGDPNSKVHIFAELAGVQHQFLLSVLFLFSLNGLIYYTNNRGVMNSD